MEDNELIALLDRKFSESEERMTARMDARFEQVDVRFREVGIRLEHMHGLIKRTAEGVQNVDEKLDRFRLETLDELKDIRFDLRISFHLLNKRVTDLENRQA